MRNFQTHGTYACSQRRGDCATEIGGACAAADVGRAWRATCGMQDFFYRRPHGGMRLLVPQELQHHRATPDLADRIGDVAPGDVRRGAVHRLEERGKFPVWVEVGAGSDAYRASARR